MKAFPCKWSGPTTEFGLQVSLAEYRFPDDSFLSLGQTIDSPGREKSLSGLTILRLASLLPSTHVASKTFAGGSEGSCGGPSRRGPGLRSFCVGRHGAAVEGDRSSTDRDRS